MPPTLKETFGRFLGIADRHGISTVVILFDDCFKPEPRVGKQPDPEPGMHNSQWVQSPGARRRGDRAAWPGLEQYVKGLVGAFALDKRVLAWEHHDILRPDGTPCNPREVEFIKATIARLPANSAPP